MFTRSIFKTLFVDSICDFPEHWFPFSILDSARSGSRVVSETQGCRKRWMELRHQHGAAN